MLPLAHRPRIVLLVSHLQAPTAPSQLAQLIAQVAPDYAATACIRVLECALPDTIAQAQALERAHEVDAFVCTGASAAYLRQHVSRPTLSMRVGGRDLLRALDQARRLSGKVAIVSYPHISAELDRMAPLFTLQLRQACYTTLAEARACVADLAGAGYRTIIGSALVVELAQQAGLDGVLALSRDALCEALDDAVAACRLQRRDEAGREQLDAVLRHVSEGVITLDAAGLVRSINPAMMQLLDVRSDWACGRALAEVAPGLDAGAVLRTGLAEQERVLKLGRRTVLATLAPLHEAGQTAGALLTCRDMGDTQRAERRIRVPARPGQFSARHELAQISGGGAAIAKVLALARSYGGSDATVLIGGESGTGKELLAQGIHNAGRRRDAPFVAINCAAFTETLLESELFGYEDGAFSGARKGGKPGLFEMAHGGTVFLDEIGDMPVALQTRLLRVLQEREVMRLGATEMVPIDVRVISATHCDLRARIADGRFRADLYYRLNILRLEAPPLRERRSDLPAIAEAILQKILTQPEQQMRAAALLATLLPHMMAYHWPGNIRELENLLQRAAVALSDSDDDAHSSAELRALIPEFFERPPALAQPGLHAVSGAQQARHIEAVLAACNGNLDEAARQLAISRTTLWRRLRATAA